MKGVSTTDYRYNALGRVTSSTQTTDNTPYTFSYGYSLAGDLKTVTYPSGRVASYGLSQAGRPQNVGSWATAITYAPHGAISGLTMGNGVQETDGYDARLRPAGITAAKASSLLSLTNTYALNGNVSAQQIAFGSAPTTYTQSFGYDGVNRLTTAKETNNGTTSPIWTQTNGYDLYGNRAATSSFPQNPSTPTNITQFDANNRIAFTPSGIAMPLDAYDKAGNLQDHPQMGQFVYDAENRMTTATVGGVATSYTYDGEGRRVKAFGPAGPAGNKVFVYGVGGELMAEYGSGTDTGTRYITSDGLGSTRLVTDGAGTVLARYDYEPFGGELPALSNSSVRTPANNFGSPDPGVRQKFTGKERDVESGLDYFGARYYGSSMGRWTSPDPENTGALAMDPQSWNMYSYVRNNPVRNVDPTGLSWRVCVNDGNGGQACQTLNDDEYRSLFIEQNGKQGINLPNSIAGGSITCGGGVCGSASYTQDALQDETVGMGLGAIVGGAASKAVSAAAGWLGGIAGELLGRGATETAAQIVPKAVRLTKVFGQLDQAPAARTASEAMSLVNNTLEQVEDSYGIPKDANPGLTSERMYPAQADRITHGSDGSITAVSKGHVAQYGSDGSIVIKSRATKEIIYQKAGGN